MQLDEYVGNGFIIHLSDIITWDINYIKINIVF